MKLAFKFVALTAVGVIALAGDARAQDGPALDTCIQAALESSPGLQAAAYRVAAAQGAVRQARAAYLPLIRTVAAYSLTDNPPQAFMMTLNQRNLTLDGDFNHPEDTDNLRLSLEARYRLLDGGRRGLDRQAAVLATEAEAAMLRAAQNQLIHEVTRAYYGALQASAYVRVQQNSVASLVESLRVAGERFEAGSVVKTDVLNLEVRLAEARENLIRASNGVHLATAALNTAIGSPLVAEGTITEPARDAVPAPPPVFDPDAFEGRPELAAAQRAAAAAEKAWRRARRDALPAVNAFGSWDFDSDVSSDFEDSYLVGVTAEWDLFTGFRRAGASDQAEAQWRAARAGEADARNRFALDLRQAHLEADEAWARLAVVRAGIASAEEALRITRERYERGAADITELLTAEVGLSATRMRDASARYDYRIALSNVARAGGRLAAQYLDGTNRD